jgi:hypothetical protein
MHGKGWLLFHGFRSDLAFELSLRVYNPGQFDHQPIYISGKVLCCQCPSMPDPTLVSNLLSAMSTLFYVISSGRSVMARQTDTEIKCSVVLKQTVLMNGTISASCLGCVIGG